MTRYIITYDLRAPGRNYDALYKRIKSFGTWARITESSWAIVSDKKETAVRDYLLKALDSNDWLLVGPLGSSAWYGLPKDVSDWLQTNTQY